MEPIYASLAMLSLYAQVPGVYGALEPWRGLGNKLSLAAGKALVEKKKVIVKPPPGGKHHHHHKHKDKHSSDDETGSDYSGSSYETDSSDSESSAFACAINGCFKVVKNLNSRFTQFF